MAEPLRVLCLDIEGGFGGSSRSLHESLSHMDRARVRPEVWCRRDGPVRARYEALGVTCRVVPGMPRFSPVIRLSRNLADLAAFMRDFLAWRPQRAELLRAIRDNFDLVHFNHENLFLLARWLRARHAKPQTIHVRTEMYENAFGRWQCRILPEAADRLVFITENERARVEALRGAPVTNGAVIYNIASPASTVAPHPAIPRDGRLKVAMISNFSLIRGSDRVVDIAAELAARGRRDILFVMAGDMKVREEIGGEFGRIVRAGGTLADHAAARGVDGMILFLGHVPEPETVLAGCDVLLKPTRENNPWGRDILEAMAAGKPVISVGSYDRFVETGQTGFLLRDYDTRETADILVSLDADRDLGRMLGEAARLRVARLCDGPVRAAELLRVWQDAAAARKAA